MSRERSIRILILIVFLLMGACSTVSRNDHEYYSLSFYYSSFYKHEVRVQTVKVLNRDVRKGVRSNSPHRTNIHFGREDCTPAALLNSTADFAWWEKRFTDPESKTSAPMKPEQRLSCSLPFPEFDLKQDWVCHYTLQRDNKWVGQFYGVKVKPVEAKPTDHKSRKRPQQRWLHVYFRNQTNKEIWFSRPDGKLVSADTETKLFLENVPADGKFCGFAAHAQNGSIYRLNADSKIVGVWGHVGEQGQPFEFTLPEFSEDGKDWYCYFTLKQDGEWTLLFEGN